MEDLSRWVREAGWWVRRCCCGEEDEDEEEKGRREEEEDDEEEEVKMKGLSFRKSRSSTSLPPAEVFDKTDHSCVSNTTPGFHFSWLNIFFLIFFRTYLLVFVTVMVCSVVQCGFWLFYLQHIHGCPLLLCTPCCYFL